MEGVWVMSEGSCMLSRGGSVKASKDSSIGVTLLAATLSPSTFQYLLSVWALSERSSMLSGGDSIKTRRERPVSAALFSCRLVSQFLPIFTVCLGKGGGASVVSRRCLGVV